MRFMVMVKADKDSEAGVMPSEKLLTEMGKYNEELVKAGVMLAGEGLHPSSKGARVKFSGEQAHGDRRAVRRDEGADRRLLAVAGEVEGRGDRVAQALPTRSTRRPRSRFARCSRRRTSAPSSRPSCGSRRSACARRWPRSRKPDSKRGMHPRSLVTRRSLCASRESGTRQNRSGSPGAFPQPRPASLHYPSCGTKPGPTRGSSSKGVSATDRVSRGTRRP